LFKRNLKRTMEGDKIGKNTQTFYTQTV
jgi:hypothetical protein